MSSGNLNISKKVLGDEVQISLSGNIDEKFDPTALLEHKKSVFKIDLNEVKTINSTGLREWIRFIEALGPDVRIEYYNCPAIIIQQMNLVFGFLTKNSFVMSFYAIYFCEENDEDRSVLIQSSEVVNNIPPVITTMIDGQKAEMEFDGVPERYFKFLKK